MLRLNFLEDLKRSFEVLAELCQGELRAEWNPKGWIFTDDGGPIEPSDQWIVTGCDYPHVRSLFRLARRGALALGFLEKHNSSAYWLEQLRLKYLYCGFEEITAKSNIRLSDKRHELIKFPGTVIANVCRASIELCEELILDSIQEDLTSAALGRPAATIEDVVRKTTGSTLLLEAKVNAIDSEFSANRKIGVSAHRATARALLQIFDALIENVIMGNNDQGWDLTKEKLESDIPRRAFAIAANQEWVSKRSKSDSLEDFPRWRSLFNRRARFAIALLGASGQGPCPESASRFDWGEFAPLSAGLEYLAKRRSREYLGRTSSDLETRSLYEEQAGSDQKTIREKILKDYQDRCFAEQNTRIFYQDVRRIAGYKAENAIYAWLRTGKGDKRFRPVLTKATGEFVSEAIKLRGVEY